MVVFFYYKLLLTCSSGASRTLNGILEILREAFRGLRRSLTLLEETGVREYGEEGSLMMLARRGRYENRFRFSADCCSGSRESDEEEDSLKSSICAPRISFLRREL